MSIRAHIVFAAAALGAWLFATALHAAQNSMVGDWFEESTHQGPRIISIATIRPDGTLTARFRRCLPGGALDSAWNGRWTYTNGIMRVSILNAAGAVVSVDDYKTDSFDGRIWTYRLVKGPGFDRWGEVKFRDVRVTPESRMPECDTLS